MLLFITTRWMGAENKGLISLFVLNLSVASILSGLFGGPSLVYLAPRFSSKALITINYSWAILVSVGLTCLLFFTSLPLSIPPLYFGLLAILECITAVNLMMLLGKNKVKEHNWLQIIKVFITVVVLFVDYSFQELSFESFVRAYGISLIITSVASIVLMVRNKRITLEKTPFKIILKEALKYGSLVQIGSIAQLLNYRLSYYILELLISPPSVALIRIGIFHTSVQVAEALWQFAKSIGTVQYATVSNLRNRNEGLRISLKLAKLNYSVTGLGVLILLLIPANFYSQVLGSEFGEIKAHLYYLAPGIFILSISNAFSHFFAGVGDHRFNTYSSVFGLILTCLLIYPSIIMFGTYGAALAASTVYCLQTIYQYWHMYSKDGVHIKHLLLTIDDFAEFKVIGTKLIKR